MNMYARIYIHHLYILQIDSNEYINFHYKLLIMTILLDFCYL